MSSECKNCGESTGPGFCGHCGQPVTDRRAPVGSLLSEYLSEFFALDGRNLRTLKTLLRPGRLTELYLAGKRAPYARPMRLYFVSSLLFFLMVGGGIPQAENFDVYVDGQLLGDRPASTDRGNLELLSIDRSDRLGQLLFERLSEKRDRFREMEVQPLLDSFFGSLQRAVPTALILFVPFLALALKLLYLRSRILYFDHVIFALHFQSFLFLALTLAGIANAIGLAKIASAGPVYLAVALVAGPAYLALALRHRYRQSWAWTVIKTLLLGVIYLGLFRLATLATVLVVLDRM